MAKCNKIVSNIAQDFDNTEKRQARTNIDASQINYVDALPGHQPTSQVGDLYVVEYESGKHFNDGTTNIGMLVPEPASGTNGFVLQTTSAGVRWMNQQELPDSVMMDSYERASSPNPTNLIATEWCNHYGYNQIMGWITLHTTSSGSFSVVPCDGSANYMGKYGSQCTNITAIPTGADYTFPFYFRADGTADIRQVGIKGGSNGNVTIRNLFVLGKKNANDSRSSS